MQFIFIGYNTHSRTSYAFTFVAVLIKVLECISPPEPTLIEGHCTKTSIIVGELLRENLDTLKAFVTTTVGLQLNLGETACIRVHFPDADGTTNVTLKLNQTDTFGKNMELNGTVFYSLQFQGLRQIYPIRQQYTFAIPQFESKCICDCPGGENHCAVGYNYRNCSKSAYCVTTYHPHQKATGCFAGEEAELCCDVTVTAYKNMKFDAVHLSQPSTAGQFAYKVYVFKNDQWSVKKSEQFQVPLNHDHRLEFSDDKLEMQISGTKSYWQLDSGMYFYEINDDASSNNNKFINSQLRTGVPVNELYEWNTGKLGWFRMEAGRWTVANGWLEIQDAHHVQVEHCKDQRYTDNYKAHYFSSVGKNRTGSNEQMGIYLGHSIIESEPWVDSVILPNSDKGVDRQITLLTKESPTITVNLNLNSRVELKFYFHESDVKDFNGIIQLDKHSSKYLNLTIIEAKGTLIGAVYRNEKKQNSDLAFSTNVESTEDRRYINSSVILLLPSDVNSSRYLCLHPSEKSNVEICKWVEYHSVPLEYFDILRGWYSNQGECPGCNEMTWNSFFQYLNPKQWFDGISSASEAFAMILEIGFYLIVIVLFIAICRRCVCPVLKVIVCGGSKSGKPAE